MTKALRVHWFSPLPPERTGVAEFSASVIPALAHQGNLTVWTSQRERAPEIERIAEVKYFDVEATPLPNGPGDICVYNLGANGSYHTEIWRASFRQPGIVVLHDLCLHALRQSLRKTHPTDAKSAARVRGGRGHAQPRPGTFEELGIERARGVVAHTRTGFEDLVRCGLPSLRAELPYVLPVSRPAEAWTGWLDRFRRGLAQGRARFGGKPHGTLRRLTIFGYLGWNRRLGSTIQALACMPEREQFHLDVYGEVYQPHLRPLARRSGLKRGIRFHGYVPDDVLDRALAESHLVINLRHPTMGESSISQLRLWAHALPSVVTREGWYAELDDDVVEFVRPEHEIDDLQRVLRRLLTDPEHFLAQGRRGRERLNTIHHPERYAQKIFDFAQRIRAGAPLVESLS